MYNVDSKARCSEANYIDTSCTHRELPGLLAPPKHRGGTGWMDGWLAFPKQFPRHRPTPPSPSAGMGKKARGEQAKPEQPASIKTSLGSHRRSNGDHPPPSPCLLSSLSSSSSSFSSSSSPHKPHILFYCIDFEGRSGSTSTLLAPSLSLVRSLPHTSVSFTLSTARSSLVPPVSIARIVEYSPGKKAPPQDESSSCSKQRPSMRTSAANR